MDSLVLWLRAGSRGTAGDNEQDAYGQEIQIPVRQFVIVR